MLSNSWIGWDGGTCWISLSLSLNLIGLRSKLRFHMRFCCDLMSSINTENKNKTKLRLHDFIYPWSPPVLHFLRFLWGDIQPMKPVLTNQNCEQNKVSISKGAPPSTTHTATCILLNASMTLEDPPSLLHSSTPQVETSGRTNSHQDLSVFQCSKWHLAIQAFMNESHMITLLARHLWCKPEPISNPRCFSWIHPTSRGGSLWG